MPDSFMIDGREKFRRDCAWWAFRRASKLSYIRYQVMKEDARKVWQPIEEAAFANQKEIEEEALRLHKSNPAQAEAFLTKYCIETAEKAVEAFWKLGDDFWSRYNNLW
jgi:dipeptidase